MSLARWLILLGAIVLFCGAIAHMIGYTFFIPALVKNNWPHHLRRCRPSGLAGLLVAYGFA